MEHPWLEDITPQKMRPEEVEGWLKKRVQKYEEYHIVRPLLEIPKLELGLHFLQLMI